MNKLIKQAFTLIELLVVIAIIGILSGLIVVSMSGVTEKANIAKSQVFSSSLRNALMLNIVAEYKLDETSGTTYVYNSWSDNYHCRLGATTATEASDPTVISSNCISGNCLSFDGSDDYAVCGNINIISSLTVEYWLYINAYASDNYVFPISKGYAPNSGTSWTVGLTRYGSGYFFIRRGDNSSYMYAEGSGWTSILPKKWIHMVHVFDGSKTYGATYQNGKIDRERTDMPSASINSTSLSVQLGGGTGTLFFNGILDGIRIYDSAITSVQIKENYYVGLNSLFASGQISMNDYKERINSIAKQ
jgi:prepilin-type N-terminal cleavage/methylation domain-containing protein